MAKQINSMQIATLKLMSEGGTIRIPADSRSGDVNRPVATGWPGARVATFETLFDYFINNVPDPDTALASDPNFDEKLRQQPDVHATMRLRELTVAAMPMHFEPSAHKDINKDFARDAADYCNDIFDSLPNTNDLYRQMQNAVLMGGQGHEWVWARDGNGHERPVAFYPVHKSRFVFDRLGNMAILTREAPVWGAYIQVSQEQALAAGPDGMKIFPALPGKFTYHKYMAEGGPWFRPAAEGYLYWGRGEDTNLYIPVTFDQFVLRFRMKWMEKFGIPTAVLHYPDTEALSDQVVRIADSIRGESVITLPKPPGGEDSFYYKLEFIDPPTSGIDVFTNFSESWTKPHIEKIILGGANLMELGPTGSYGATVSQRDSGAQIIFKYDALNIDTTINQQLVPYIMQARWPGVDPRYYPKHMMTAEIEKDRTAEVEILTAASSLVPIREDDVYSAIGYDRPKDDEKTVFNGGQQESPFDGFPTPGGAMGGQPKAGLGQKLAQHKMNSAIRKSPNPLAGAASPSARK